MSYSSEETIKAKLAERLRNTKVFILLVGNTTKNFVFNKGYRQYDNGYYNK
jgi:hypothetical protein